MNQIDREEFVTCVQAAECLDVSVSTVKRMCDQQTLDCARTSGGHRRISMQSISRWLAVQKSQDSDFSERSFEHSSLDHSPLDTDLTLNRLLSGGMADLKGFLNYLQAEGWSIPRVLDEILLNALKECRCKCDFEEIPPYSMNQCIAALRDLIGYLLLTQGTPTSHAPIAVGGCVGPSRNDVESSAIALGLGAIGCRATSIGSRVDPGDIAAAAARHDAKIVWMNCSHVVDAEELQRFAQDLSGGLSESHLMLLTGGGSCQINRRCLPCDLACDSIVELTEFVTHRVLRNSSPLIGGATQFRAA